MIRKKSSTQNRGKNSIRGKSRLKGLFRHPCFEPLESRHLLSVSLPTIANQTVLAGAPLNLALDVTSSTSNAVTYTVAVSNSNLTNSTVTNPTLGTTITSGNPSLKITVDDTVDNIHGTLLLQLFKDLAPATVDKIMSMVNSDYYNGLIFHRVIKDFMIQGGDPIGDGTGGPATKFDDEFNSLLQFTSPGLLAMAKSSDDTNGSQFFITTEATRWLDFQHTIFGMLTEGSDILGKINAVSTNSSDKPINNVVMTDISVINDVQNGVLRLSAPIGTTGTVSVTVTATDSVTHETTSQTFQVTVAADTNNDNPYLGTINPIQTNSNTSVSLNIPATDVENSQIYYNAALSTTNSNISVQVDHNTGLLVITPSNGVSGVYSLLVGVAPSSSSTSDNYDLQAVPLYINPAAPSSIQLLSDSDTGGNNADKVTNLNNTTGHTLKFRVSGVVSGSLVELYADGVLVGSATASGTTVDITTNGTVTLADGVSSITAKQTLKNQTVKVGNLDTTVDLPSTVSAALSITIDSTLPQMNFTPAQTAVIGVPYTCQAFATDSSTGGVTYELTQKPTGMSINTTTGLISWTPTTGQAVNTDVIVKSMDLAGNAVSQTYSINVLASNAAPTLNASSPAMGVTDENTAITINLSGTFINNGVGTTSISDTDDSAVKGGIALIDVSGLGKWEYSIDGTTFIAVGTVSPSSALLLAKTAVLRYTPDGKNGESPLISFRAWDTTNGVNGGRVNISQDSARGGSTAFSVSSDVAVLTVNDVNDAPILTQVNPSLGSVTPNNSKVINLTGSFINNGTGTTTISELDDNPVIGGIALVGFTGTGTWEYSLDGTTYISIGSVSNSSALLLPKTASLRFTPSGTDTSTATITYRAWDTTAGQAGGMVDVTVNGNATAFSTNTDTATLIVNNAPDLTQASPSLGSTDENTIKTINLSGTFINNGTNTTLISDLNSSNTIGGIALVGFTGNGTWSYSTNGTTFTVVGTVSETSALLLPSNAVLRYIPDNKNSETATIKYRAWDATSGQSGTKVDVSVNGGSTAFSSVSDTASVNVTAVNDAPVLTAKSPSMGSIDLNIATTINLSTFINNGTNTTGIDDVDTGAVKGGIALTGITGNGTWEYSLDGTTFHTITSVSTTSSLLLNKDAVLRYTSTGTGGVAPSITYLAWDTTTGSSGDVVDTTSNGGSTAFSLATDTATLTVKTASISGFVYIDADNDGLRVTQSGKTHLALPGVVLNLYMKNTSGAWELNQSAMTAMNGSYKFEGLAAGTYRVSELQPSNYIDGKETAGTINGTQSGTAGADQIDVALGSGVNAIEFNFGERGLKASMISMGMALASTPLPTTLVTQLNVAPTVVLSPSTSSSDYSTTFHAGSSAVAVASSSALVTDTDSQMLASMTVRITNPLDGASEALTAVVQNTSIKSTYANNVLTLSGVASIDAYMAALRTIKYSNSSTSPQTETREIEILTYDGIVESEPVKADIIIG